MSNFDYKKKKQELAEIIDKLQENNVEDLDESIKLYKKAKSIITEIEKYLNSAENEIEKIK
jgi:exodeoxyribonuclease VII small subunit